MATATTLTLPFFGWLVIETCIITGQHWTWKAKRRRRETGVVFISLLIIVRCCNYNFFEAKQIKYALSPHKIASHVRAWWRSLYFHLLCAFPLWFSCSLLENFWCRPAEDGKAKFILRSNKFNFQSAQETFWWAAQRWNVVVREIKFMDCCIKPSLGHECMARLVRLIPWELGHTCNGFSEGRKKNARNVEREGEEKSLLMHSIRSFWLAARLRH